MSKEIAELGKSIPEIKASERRVAFLKLEHNK